MSFFGIIYCSRLSFQGMLKSCGRSTSEYPDTVYISSNLCYQSLVILGSMRLKISFCIGLVDCIADLI
jgi:hypothetical protein